MQITCPKCGKPSQHDEAFLGPKGSILRCALCGSFLKIFNRRTSDEIGPAMWVVRKEGGDVVQVDRLSTLQRWVLDRTVGRKDELLRSGQGWVHVEDVPELGGLLHLARLDEDARRAEMWKMPTLNMGTEEPAAPAGKTKEPAKKKKADDETPEDEDTVQIPGKVLEESIKLSEADEIITAEILLLDEVAGEEAETGEKPEPEPGEPPVMLVKKSARMKPKPKLEPVAEPPEPVSPAVPVLEIAGEVTESPWSEDEEEPAPARAPRRGLRLAVQITLIVVLALVAGAVYVQRDRVYEWRFIFFPPAGQENTVGTVRDAESMPEETPESGEAEVAAAADEGSDGLQPVEEGGSGEDDEVQESSGKGGGGYKGYEEHYKKALALQHSGACDRAVEFYRKAIEKDHQHAEAWTGIGECYDKLGKSNNAINSFKSALHYNSKYGPALLGLADALKKQGKLEAALGYYTRYLETSPGGSYVASVRKNVEEIKAALEDGGSSKKDKIGIPENPYGP
jgi:hypothetical protein